MEILIHETSQEACDHAVQVIARLIRQKPNAVLGLATGRTPLGVYQGLIQKHRQEGLDFSRVTTFNLDEYVGIPADHAASYHRFMWENFFSHVNINSMQVHIPDGMTSDVAKHCKDYEKKIASVGGIDLQLLGIGGEGHIGFNEPSSSLTSRTRLKILISKTIEDNRFSFQDHETVPRTAITMGIGTIMEARKILLMAYGASKAEIVARSFEGPVTTRVPASILQMHSQTLVLLDSLAASRLELVDYYRSTYAFSEEWNLYENQKTVQN
jgi:glucosamine-6-phosphate deaminase